MDPILIIALLAFLMTCWASINIAIGMGKMRPLASINPLSQKNLPKVSIIVPACNEEYSLETAARSLLTLDYPNLEVIMMNDRSTDGTGRVLDKLQDEYPQLQVHRIDDLPAGWLGKNNAMHQGAMHAKGEYLLFTDADVIMEKTTLSRAMAVIKSNLDHLSLFFLRILLPELF